MTQPRDAARAPGGRRFYQWRGETYWSVTTIIGGGLPKPALLPWGIKAVATAAVQRRTALQAMLAGCETPEACAKGTFCQGCDEAVRWLKGAPYAQRDRAADLGGQVHVAAEAYKLGKPMPPWPVAIAPRMQQYERFLAAYKPRFEATEASVYSRSQRYAGTLDAILEIDGRLYIVDYKSSEKGPYPEVGLQLAAYRHAEFIALPDGSEAPMPKVDAAAVLALRDDHYLFQEVRADADIYRVFLYCRETFRFLEETSKSVLGELVMPVNLVPESVPA